ncbi:rcc01693 family protein [Rhizobium sp. BK251]|uniref:rcc01693 family protein n=1 Tax=Rhizobium sp. BK251 TaxID=2512125 RepID=UPI002478347F|nr:rcc01693 family protein [Rhizobium sp. BK251]
MKAGRREPFPWGRVMHAGLCLLRLDPQTFWALTPAEFHAMTGGLSPRAAAIDRTGLDALMQLHPDQVTSFQR